MGNNAVARRANTASVSRDASTSILMSSLERAGIGVAVVFENEHRRRCDHGRVGDQRVGHVCNRCRPEPGAVRNLTRP